MMMNWADVLNKNDEGTVMEFLDENGQEVGGNADSAAGTSMVMTEEQMEMLKKQIVVFQILSDSLRQMYRDLSSSQSIPGTGRRTGEMCCDLDPLLSSSSELTKITTRQRWSPTPMQLQILEGIFDKDNAIRDKQKIREIASNLSQYGVVSEANVYNWFQNRRARCRRNQKKGRSTLPRTALVSGAASKNDSDGGTSNHKRSSVAVDDTHLCENPKRPRLVENQGKDSEQIRPELPIANVDFDAEFAFLFSDDHDCTSNHCENPERPRLVEDQTKDSEQTNIDFDAEFAFLFSDDHDCTSNHCENPEWPKLVEDQTKDSEQTNIDFDAEFAFLFSDDNDQVVTHCLNPIVV